MLGAGLAALSLAACAAPSRAPTAADVATPEPDSASPDDSAAPSGDTAALPDDIPPPDDVAAPKFPVPAPATVGDADRPAPVLVPADYDGQTALPALVILGGYWWTAADLNEWLGLSAPALARQMVVVLPDGTVDSDGAPFWNATHTCCDYYGSGVDDVGYLTRLLDDLTTRVNIDPNRIVLLGHSNGGFMAYRMACELAPRIAGVVSMAGAGFVDPAECQAQAAVSVLQIHGTADEVLPFEGDAEAPGAMEMMRRWGARAGCDLDTVASAPHPQVLFDGTTQVSRFAEGCQAPFDVRLWTLEGADHYPEVTPAFAGAVLDWVATADRGGCPSSSTSRCAR